jgi:hypothetical protein
MAMFRNVTGSPFPVGNNPVSNAVADLNGDGHLDILTTNYISDNVSVLLGDGHGGFTPGTPVPVTNGPREVEVGDLDGDGDVDALVTNYSGNNVSVMLNNGNGTFAAPTSVPVGTVPRGLAIGDLDGDGDLDFVAANYGSNTLSVMLNNGNATFTQAVGSPIPAPTHPVAVVLADFNGDSRPEIAVTDNTLNTVLIFPNGFGATVSVPTGSSPRGLAAGDIDGDGDNDLVVGNFLANSVSVLKNNGSGAFTPSGSPVPTGNNPYAVTMGDLDGDGDLDVAVTNSGSSSVTVLLNDGTGVFTPASGSPFPVGVSPGGVAMGDFDEDGDLDLTTANFGSNTASALLNTTSSYSIAAGHPAVEGTAPGVGGHLLFTVTRTATSEAEAVNVTLGGTATSGTDYTAPSAVVSFAVGQSTALINVAIKRDAVREHDETVVLTLNGPSGEGHINPHHASATGIILDDEPRTINGTNHADVLNGRPFVDTINGLAGNDVIHGGGGNDRLVGGRGADRIAGDAGHDVFAFTSILDSAGANRDIILDFTHNQDKIGLSAIDADATLPGNQAFQWIGQTGFTHSPRQLNETLVNRPGTTADRTIISADVNGDAVADMQIVLIGLKHLVASDFQL